jgi:hypothetical protein
MLRLHIRIALQQRQEMPMTRNAAIGRKNVATRNNKRSVTVWIPPGQANRRYGAA